MYKKENHKKNHVFLLILMLCGLILLSSGFLLFRKDHDMPGSEIFAFQSSDIECEDENTYYISINEQDTLEQIAQRHGISFERLCTELKIDASTNPKLKICELFDACKDE